MTHETPKVSIFLSRERSDSTREAGQTAARILLQHGLREWIARPAGKDV